MPRFVIRQLARGLAGAALFALVSVGLAADTVRWTLVVKPSGGGFMDWETSSPVRDGTSSGRKVVSFDKDTYLDVWVEANEGFRLVSFRKDDQEMIFFLDIFNHFQFGPVGGSHTLTATFVPVLPEGTFDLSAPVDDPAFTNVVDLTGSYNGTTPTSTARAYGIDVAQDESGKISGMGTVAGIQQNGGDQLSSGGGKIATVNGEPTVAGKGKFVGTRDGVETTTKASLKGPAELQGPGGDVGQTNVTYKSNVGGVKFADKNVPMEAPLAPASAANVSREWSIQIDLVERDATKAKPHVAASAVLTLPNGDVIEFAEKKAKYTPKNGLKIVFKKGTNTTIIPNAVDKKTKVTIKNMTLMQVGDDWVITGGQIKYKFLGQKGVGDVLDFVTP